MPEDEQCIAPNAQSHGSGPRISVPPTEPLDQRTRLAQGGESSIDGIVVAPDDVGKRPVGDARFDITAVESAIVLDVEAVGAAGDRALGIDGASAR